jgi:hypothetical protein
VRGRVLVGQSTVSGAPNHVARAHDHAADRHLAARTGGAGLVEGKLHEGG